MVLCPTETYLDRWTRHILGYGWVLHQHGRLSLYAKKTLLQNHESLMDRLGRNRSLTGTIYAYVAFLIDASAPTTVLLAVI